MCGEYVCKLIRSCLNMTQPPKLRYGFCKLIYLLVSICCLRSAKLM